MHTVSAIAGRASPETLSSEMFVPTACREVRPASGSRRLRRRLTTRAERGAHPRLPPRTPIGAHRHGPAGVPIPAVVVLSGPARVDRSGGRRPTPRLRCADLERRCTAQCALWTGEPLLRFRSVAFEELDRPPHDARGPQQTIRFVGLEPPLAFAPAESAHGNVHECRSRRRGQRAIWQHHQAVWPDGSIRSMPVLLRVAVRDARLARRLAPDGAWLTPAARVVAAPPRS